MGGRSGRYCPFEVAFPRLLSLVPWARRLGGTAARGACGGLLALAVEGCVGSEYLVK